MLPHTEMIHRFLDQVIPGINGNLSIKVRLGWRRADEIFRLLPILNQFPLAELIIHPRTGLQRYEGNTDLEAFGQCLSMVRHPVVYNGDIRNLKIFTRLSRKFQGVSRWMIGRWCLADPFLPMNIKSGTNEIRSNIRKMKQFHAALLEQYRMALDGPGHVLNKMKGLWKFFSLPFADCSQSLNKIKKATRTDQYLDLVNRFFDTEAKLL